MDNIPKDPEGNIKLDGFAIDSLIEMEKLNPERAKAWRIAVLKNTNENYTRTGIIFTSFDVLRALIEEQEKMSEEANKNGNNQKGL